MNAGDMSLAAGGVLLVCLVGALVFLGGFKLPKNYEKQVSAREEIRKKILQLKMEKDPSEPPPPEA